MLFISAGDLMTLFLGLELSSLPMYVLLDLRTISALTRLVRLFFSVHFLPHFYC